MYIFNNRFYDDLHYSLFLPQPHKKSEITSLLFDSFIQTPLIRGLFVSSGVEDEGSEPPVSAVHCTQRSIRRHEGGALYLQL